MQIKTIKDSNITLSEISQIQKDKYGITYMGNLKKGGTNELIYKTEVEAWMQETNLWIPGWGGINWKIGTDVYTLLYIKYITNNNLLYIAQGTQYSNGLRGKRILKIKVDICTTDLVCYMPETSTTLYINYTPMKVFFNF